MLVWCLCVDGPAAGQVFELDASARAIQIRGDAQDPGQHCYRRCAWGTDKGHRVAMFKYTRTLVV